MAGKQLLWTFHFGVCIFSCEALLIGWQCHSLPAKPLNISVLQVFFLFFFSFISKVKPISSVLKMEPKKKTFLENLRLKTKFPNLKKHGKKAKQGKKLAYRRSISVPDLRFGPSEHSPFPKDDGLLSAASDAIFFWASSGQSDCDSIASGSNASGPLFTDRLTVNDFAPVIRRRLPAPVDHVAYRMNAPVETLMLDEEEEDKKKSSGLESKVKFSDEASTPVDKSAKIMKGNLPTSISVPVPLPRSITSSIPALPPLVNRENPSTNRLYTTDNTSTNRGGVGSVGVAVARARSFGDQVNLMEKQIPLCERKILSSDKWTPPAIRTNVTADKWSLPNDSVRTPPDSTDGTSLDSTCGTPTDEQVTMPWTTDSEDLEQEPFSPLFSEILSMEEAQLEGSQEDLVEVSHSTVLFLFHALYAQSHGHILI